MQAVLMPPALPPTNVFSHQEWIKLWNRNLPRSKTPCVTLTQLTALTVVTNLTAKLSANPHPLPQQTDAATKTWDSQTCLT